MPSALSAHVQVGEEAENTSGCVAKSACCCKLSAQPCQPSNCHFLFRWPMKPSLRHAANRSGCLVRSNRLRLEFTLIAGRPFSHPESIAQTPMSGRPPSPFLGSATLAQNQALRARREKLLLRKTRALPGFRSIPCPRPEPERLPDHKAGQRGRPRTNGGHHEQFRTSGEGSQGSHPLH